MVVGFQRKTQYLGKEILISSWIDPYLTQQETARIKAIGTHLFLRSDILSIFALSFENFRINFPVPWSIEFTQENPLPSAEN